MSTQAAGITHLVAYDQLRLQARRPRQRSASLPRRATKEADADGGPGVWRAWSSRLQRGPRQAARPSCCRRKPKVKLHDRPVARTPTVLCVVSWTAQFLTNVSSCTHTAENGSGAWSSTQCFRQLTRTSLRGVGLDKSHSSTCKMSRGACSGQKPRVVNQ